MLRSLQVHLKIYIAYIVPLSSRCKFCLQPPVCLSVCAYVYVYRDVRSENDSTEFN